MKLVRSFILASFLVTGAASASAQGVPQLEAQRVATSFLLNLELEDYEGAYELFAEEVRNLTADEAFRADMARLATRLGGPSRDRTLISASPRSAVPGPNGEPILGEFIGLQFETEYPAGRFQENIMVKRESGEWSVVGFFWAPASL